MRREAKSKKDAKKLIFLRELGQGWSVTKAAELAGVAATSTVYAWRDEDPDFAKEWEAAYNSGTDRLEDNALERAKTDSDVLMIFTLKGRRPEKWRDNTEAGGGGRVINVVVNINRDSKTFFERGGSIIDGEATRVPAGPTKLEEPTVATAVKRLGFVSDDLDSDLSLAASGYGKTQEFTQDERLQLKDAEERVRLHNERVRNGR
jgi:hypothetical protein